jgi:four helix bundle protein
MVIPQGEENIHFCYYARGSISETKTWLTKANNRNLIRRDVYESLLSSLEIIHKKLNGYIKSIGIKTTSDK